MNLDIKNKLYVLIGLLCVLVLFAFVCICYGSGIEAYVQLMVIRFSSPIPGASSVQLVRGLATYKDLWMNGYLGLFFNSQPTGTGLPELYH